MVTELHPGFNLVHGCFNALRQDELTRLFGFFSVSQTRHFFQILSSLPVCVFLLEQLPEKTSPTITGITKSYIYIRGVTTNCPVQRG